MTETKTLYFYRDVDNSSASFQPSVLSWLYWLRAWLGLCCDMPVEDMENMESEYEGAGYAPWAYERPVYLNNRRHRRWVSHYHRCGSTEADSHYVLKSLQKRGLSGAQMQERLARVSPLGRVYIYGMSITSCVRLRRPLLNCYDHGWWRSPLLRVCPEPLRPP